MLADKPLFADIEENYHNMYSSVIVTYICIHAGQVYGCYTSKDYYFYTFFYVTVPGVITLFILNIFAEMWLY